MSSSAPVYAQWVYDTLPIVFGVLALSLTAACLCQHEKGSPLLRFDYRDVRKCFSSSWLGEMFLAGLQLQSLLCTP